MTLIYIFIGSLFFLKKESNKYGKSQLLNMGSKKNELIFLFKFIYEKLIRTYTHQKRKEKHIVFVKLEEFEIIFFKNQFNEKKNYI